MRALGNQSITAEEISERKEKYAASVEEIKNAAQAAQASLVHCFARGSALCSDPSAHCERVVCHFLRACDLHTVVPYFKRAELTCGSYLAGLQEKLANLSN